MFVNRFIMMLVFSFVFISQASFAQNQEMPADVISETQDETEQVAEDVMDDANAQNEMMAQDLPELNAQELTDEELNLDTLPQALAIIEGTSEDSELYGEVELLETEEGLMVNAEVYNAPPGKHGFHIHENASCDDAGNAAGGHFNPEGVQHGLLPKDGHTMAHLGDMGNIEINEDGEGSLSVVLSGVGLAEGINSVAGKAIILHEKEDDFGQPTGNAGGRIGCGIIETITEENY